MTREVESVVTLAGGTRAGVVRIIDLPEPVAGKTRAAVAFVTEADLRDDPWVAVAFDARGRVIGRDVLP